MADEPSIFESKPEHVKRLFQYVLAQPAAEDDAPPATSIDMIAEKPGGLIDRYLLQSVLGEGGMGIVFLAEQEEPVKRQVALKVINETSSRSQGNQAGHGFETGDRPV